MGVGRMHPTAIYGALKRYLSELTNRPISDIVAAMALKANPPNGLGFDPAGLRQLAIRLNKYFADHGHPLKPTLAPFETQGAKTVRDLFSLIRRRLD